ncbi:MAG TPA: MCP four helix bundle domain-containing protein [Prolixibacteraceae bacterium]|nr:MCP four helix bundle domain-containing protein [Prolixibacteraceae bacterium]
MKLSIRTKFTLGMVFIFLIILVLLGFSAFYLNKLSNKTSAILKENYLSVVYAREMTDGISKISQEMTTAFLEKRNAEKATITRQLEAIDRALQKEKGNFTEVGEDKLVGDFETVFDEYREKVTKLADSVLSPEELLYFQKKQAFLEQQLVLLSQMNGKAIEVKTDDAKVSSRNALTGMTILGSCCFLIALSFIYSFASYFNERFFQLYNGIKEIVSSNYGQRLYFDGVDEFSEISVLFNQMAEKLSGEQVQETEQQFDFSNETVSEEGEMEELKDLIVRMKSIEKQAEDFLNRKL